MPCSDSPHADETPTPIIMGRCKASAVAGRGAAMTRLGVPGPGRGRVSSVSGGSRDEVVHSRWRWRIASSATGFARNRFGVGCRDCCHFSVQSLRLLALRTNTPFSVLFSLLSTQVTPVQLCCDQCRNGSRFRAQDPRSQSNATETGAIGDHQISVAQTALGSD